jgi:uncharacterized protein (TIGR03067 family)
MRTRSIVALTFALLAPVLLRADDAKDLQGNWVPVKGELDGARVPDELLKATKLHLGAGKYNVEIGKEKDAGTFKFDATKKPKQMDITSTDGPNKGKTLHAIYELSGDTLTVCYALDGKGRPAEFKTAKESNLYLVTYKRVK